jgi:hypothetical protein
MSVICTVTSVVTSHCATCVIRLRSHTAPPARVATGSGSSEPVVSSAWRCLLHCSSSTQLLRLHQITCPMKGPQSVLPSSIVPGNSAVARPMARSLPLRPAAGVLRWRDAEQLLRGSAPWPAFPVGSVSQTHWQPRLELDINY